CLQLVERYAAHYTELKPPLNRDLVVAGAILHDIGRVLELGEEVEAPALTVPGRLAGHLVLGRDLVRDVARELGAVNAELGQVLPPGRADRQGVAALVLRIAGMSPHPLEDYAVGRTGIQ